MKSIVILHLGWQRIVQSKFIFFCQVLAVAAVMIPLLIILGLKHGMIGNMRHTLTDNPTTLEFRLRTPSELTQKQLQVIQSWPETGFARLMFNVNGQSIRLGRLDAFNQAASPLAFNRNAMSCDIKPSGGGDPLIQKSNLKPPREGEIVVSAAVARQLSVQLGDTLVISVARNDNQDFFHKQLRLVGIIPQSLVARSEVYATVNLSDAIEEFVRVGRGVAKAPASVNYQAYDALILDASCCQEFAEQLASRMEFTQLEQAKGIPNIEDGRYMIRRKGLLFSSLELTDLIDTAAKASPSVPSFPWTEPLEMQLAVEGQQLHLLVLSAPSFMSGSATLCQAPPVLYVNPELAKQEHACVQIACPDGLSEFICQLKPKADIPLGEAWASPQLHSIFKQGKRVLSSWDYRSGSLRFPLVCYLSMRLYAKDLDSAPLLQQKLEAAGLSCYSRIDVIRQMKRLEYSLDIIFIIISICSGIGGSIALAFNLFNATERNRRDYALIQLMGGGRFAMMLLPLLESMLITISAAMLALSVFYAASITLRQVFSSIAGEHAICHLSVQHIIYFFVLSAIVAGIASLGACIRVLSISPSEIIRES